MVNLNPAFEAALRLREQAQEQKEWMTDLLEAHQEMPSNDILDDVAGHLAVIIALIDAQDAIIAMCLRTIDNDNEFHEKLRKRLED